MAWLETQTFEERGTMEAKLCYIEQIKHLQRSIAELDSAIEDVAMSLEELKRRSEGVHPAVKDVAMKAQKRLWRRRTKMLAAQKSPRKVAVALARELAGFIWSAAQQ